MNREELIFWLNFFCIVWLLEFLFRKPVNDLIWQFFLPPWPGFYVAMWFENLIGQHPVLYWFLFGSL